MLVPLRNAYKTLGELLTTISMLSEKHIVVTICRAMHLFQSNFVLGFSVRRNKSYFEEKHRALRPVQDCAEGYRAGRQ